VAAIRLLTITLLAGKPFDAAVPVKGVVERLSVADCVGGRLSKVSQLVAVPAVRVMRGMDASE